jgi:hypothetical protein
MQTVGVVPGYRLSLLLVCSGACACSTISDPKFEHAEERACIVTSDDFGLSAKFSYRVTWDATTRIKSQHASEAADSPVQLAWRYDADGREVAYGGFGTDTYSNFQYDTHIDEHGNVEEYRGSYPLVPDLQLPPSSANSYTGVSYANEYGADGELIASTETPYGQGLSENFAMHRTFQRDKQGRCERIETKGDGNVNNAVETRSYDASGRLAIRQVEYETPIGRQTPCQRRDTVFEYDAKGRVASSTTRCHASEGAPSLVEVHTFAADDSETIERFDYENDVVNDSTLIAGELVRFSHSKESRSAGCAVIEAEITAKPDLACHPR